MRTPILKACAWCHRVRPMTLQKQKYCEKACWYAASGKQQRGVKKSAASVEKRVQTAKAKARAVFDAEFGPVSDRERRLIVQALKRGYDRGYQHSTMRAKRRGRAA